MACRPGTRVDWALKRGKGRTGGSRRSAPLRRPNAAGTTDRPAFRVLPGPDDFALSPIADGQQLAGVAHYRDIGHPWESIPRQDFNRSMRAYDAGLRTAPNDPSLLGLIPRFSW